MPIKVVIAGFKGRMGQAAYHMVLEDPELELVGLVDPHASENELAGVPVFHDKEGVLSLDADVWIDFTIPKVAYEHTRFALEHGLEVSSRQILLLEPSCSCNLRRRQLSISRM